MCYYDCSLTETGWHKTLQLDDNRKQENAQIIRIKIKKAQLCIAQMLGRASPPLNVVNEAYIRGFDNRNARMEVRKFD